MESRLLCILSRSQFALAGSPDPATGRRIWRSPASFCDLLILMTITLLALVGCSVPPSLTPTPAPPPTGPFALISQESLLAFLEDLTAIQPYSGWRNSASQGEAEALDYIEEKLGEFKYLQDLGLDLERQSFRVFMATELWETRLHLTVDGQEVEVSADGLRGLEDGVGDLALVEGDLAAVPLKNRLDSRHWLSLFSPASDATRRGTARCP